MPVIAGGGAGNKEHVRQVIAEGEADAVSIASLLHYHLVKTLPLDNEAFVAEGNTEFLRKGGENKKIKDCDLGELKAYLLEKKIDIRPIEEAA